MKKAKGILGCLLSFIYALLVQGTVGFMLSLIFGGIQGFKLGVQGMTKQEELTAALDRAMTTEVLLTFQAIGALVCIVIFALWYYKGVIDKKEPSIKKAFEGKTILWIFLLAIGTQLGIMIILSLLMPVLPGVFDQYENHMAGLGMGATLISVIYIGIIAPISEEYIFRGVILNKGKKAMPFIYANVLQAALFGIIHANIVQGTYAFVLGLLMGVIYEKHQSILAPIALHMVINILGILIGYVPESFLETYKFVEIILLLIPIPAVIIGMVQINKNPVT